MGTATTKLIAFHGESKIKAKYLRRVRQHRKADQIIQGYGYWNNGKGCAVGCTLHSDDHHAYETELGIPEQLAAIEDAIFEGMTVERAKDWPEQFLSAAAVGADLSLVWNRFSHWLLTDAGFLAINDGNREAIAAVAELHRRVIEGDEPSDEEWSAARSAARSAAESAAWSAARSAAWSAAWSAARSAAWSAAESAAWSAARSAAWSAAWSAARSAAWSAARSASFEKMADKLIELMSACQPGAPA